MIPFKDISAPGQGVYDMSKNTDLMVMMKASGGDGISTRLYIDSELDNNYANAKKYNKVPFMYHFFGGDPTEAAFFVQAVMPLVNGDGYALDIERGTNWNPQTDPNAVERVRQFVVNFMAETHTAPWVYMNISTFNMYDWSPVTALCGLWIAAPSFSFGANVPVNHSYIAQQGPIVDGVDSDMAFLTMQQLLDYTFHDGTTTTTTTTVAPVTTTTTTEAPITTTTTTEIPQTTTTTTEPLQKISSDLGTVVENAPVMTVTTTQAVKNSNILQVIERILVSIFNRLRGQI